MNRSDPEKSRAALQSILRSIVHYARDAGGAVVAFLVGTVFTLGGLTFDLLGVHVRGRLAEAGGGLLMVCAQFWAYHKLRMRNFETEDKLKAALEETRRKLHDANKRFRQAAQSTALQMMIGPTADRTAQQRFEHAKQHFEALEAEIRSGDFSRAGEVLGFKNLFHDELRLQFAGGAGFSEWYSRLAALVQAVERFAQEVDDE